jgi:cytochrome c oxidase assembly factor 6
MSVPRSPNPATKEARAECYKHRDAYYECVDGVAGSATKCAPLRPALEGACPPSWVKYFEQRREYLAERAARIEMIEKQDRELTGK